MAPAVISPVHVHDIQAPAKLINPFYSPSATSDKDDSNYPYAQLKVSVVEVDALTLLL
jgi:sulfonate dioxygenase